MSELLPSRFTNRNKLKVMDLIDRLECHDSPEVEEAFIDYFDKYDAFRILSKIIGNSISDAQKIEELLKDF